MNGKSEWPSWLEALRPDEVTARRLHKQVMAHAESILRLPERTWHDVTAGWSAVLTPLAAGLAVAFGVLAYRASIAPQGETLTLVDDPVEEMTLESHEIQPLLGPEDAAPPALLIEENELNREAVFLAAFGSR